MVDNAPSRNGLHGFPAFYRGAFSVHCPNRQILEFVNFENLFLRSSFFGCIVERGLGIVLVLSAVAAKCRQDAGTFLGKRHL